MPWTDPELATKPAGDTRQCSCTRYSAPHEAIYIASTRHINADTGELGEVREVPMCGNSAAKVAHSYGIKHPTFNPEGVKS